VVPTVPELDEPRPGIDSGPDAGPRAKILAAGRLLIATNGADFTTQAVIRQAGVALQTFYRYFKSKDQLLLTLIGELIREHCVVLVTKARSLKDPTERLETYVRTTLSPIHIPDQLAGARFITAEHWRLHQTFPAEVWAATQPFSDLIRAELEAGSAAGTLAPRNPERDAWLMTKTIIGAYHHCAFQPDDPAIATIDDDVWYFCLAAAGGTPPKRG